MQEIRHDLLECGLLRRGQVLWQVLGRVHYSLDAGRHQPHRHGPQARSGQQGHPRGPRPGRVDQLPHSPTAARPGERHRGRVSGPGLHRGAAVEDPARGREDQDHGRRRVRDHVGHGEVPHHAQSDRGRPEEHAAHGPARLSAHPVPSAPAARARGRGSALVDGDEAAGQLRLPGRLHRAHEERQARHGRRPRVEGPAQPDHRRHRLQKVAAVRPENSRQRVDRRTLALV
mmetsp:Transcript_20814/g.46355  ORF Transcript_20814/g.46355 Transcript_20814/m.46355 type:complete len:230 (+) Transcript_20814:391-1080(+)